MKKFIAAACVSFVCVSALFSSGVYAADFPDMPDNWTTGALERAVENGLLNGSDGYILPDDNITRAQMAAIIVRAFGATKEADISEFVDVKPDAWYYSEFSRAVYMDAFNGDGNRLKPNDNITYEECFTVMSRVMDLRENNPESIEKFSDYQNIADWAKPYMISVVGNGYWDGIDNKLKPKDYITRSEFAVLMDNLVKTYINDPGTYTTFPAGNVLIRSEGVIVDGVETGDMIFVGDGVTGETQFNNIKSTNRIVVRGGSATFSGEVNNLSALGHGVNLDTSKVSKRDGKIFLKYKDTHLDFGELNI